MHPPARTDLTPEELANIRVIHRLTQPPHAHVNLPGSKEDTNRALILAALSNGDVTLHNTSLANDSLELMAALRHLGVPIHLNERLCKVTGNGGTFNEFSSTLYTGISGTSSRFLTALCLLVPGNFSLDCGPRMRERPMRDLLQAITSLKGPTLHFEGTHNHLPVRFNNPLPSAPAGGTVHMSGAVSSQFSSALLLVASRLQGGLEINVTGEQVSQSYIDMTQASLARFGIQMINDNYRRYSVPETPHFGVDNYTVESDATAATYFLALAAITGGTIRVEGISPTSTQGDAQFAHILQLMGCQVTSSPAAHWIEVSGPAHLNSCTVDMLTNPDSAQTLAVVAAFAHGRTRITGLSTLRIKETNRLEALHHELTQMGIGVDFGDDWIEIDGGEPHGATIKTYDDHRMAMSFAVAGAVIDGIQITGAHTVAKSFPEFWDTLTASGVTHEAIEDQDNPHTR